jgi:UPF0271 protein
MATVDLNSDLGEGAGTDMAIMPFVTSANIACGEHAGNDNTMRATVELAKKHRVAIGAHPGYPDRARYGRVPLDIPAPELIESVRRQIDSLIGIAARLGARVTHVKAHGALYNQAERDAGIARSILMGVQRAEGGRELVVFGPPGSAMLAEAEAFGFRTAREGFVDRTYEPDGTLRPRALRDALITDPAVAARQALGIVNDRRVKASDGSLLSLEVDTLCVHGDTPGAEEIARTVREALGAAKVKVAPFRP